MEKIDTSTNSKRIQDPYLKVVKGDPSTSFVVYSVDKNATLDVSETEMDLWMNLLKTSLMDRFNSVW